MIYSVKKPKQVDLDDMITLNPVIGCSIGCPYCYARKMNQRFKFIPDFSIPTERPKALERLKSIHNKTIFMTSMSDFSGWSQEWREFVFNEMKRNMSNQYLFLTKNPKKLAGFDCLDMNNVWIGVTVTRNMDVHRINEMTNFIKSRHYWVCFEPLHEDIKAISPSLKGKLDWVVIGNESGIRAGKIDAPDSWILNLSDQFPNTPVCIKERLKERLGDSWRNEYPNEF